MTLIPIANPKLKRRNPNQIRISEFEIRSYIAAGVSGRFGVDLSPQKAPHSGNASIRRTVPDLRNAQPLGKTRERALALLTAVHGKVLSFGIWISKFGLSSDFGCRIRHCAALTVGALLLGVVHLNAAATADAATDPVVLWNRVLLQMVRTPGVQPATIHPTRSFAILHAAMYNAVNAIFNTHRGYSADTPLAPGGASEQVAAAAAGHRVLVQLYPAAQADLDTAYQEMLASTPEAASKSESIQLGESVADQLLTARANDGANAIPSTYVFGTAPGEFQSPAPNFPPQPQFTHWSKVRPFALGSADQFRPGPPPALTDRVYTDAFNEIKAIGVTNSVTATLDEAVIGRFWNGAIQNYWNEIAQSAALQNGLSTAQSARLFALLNLALADSVIAFYDAKYTYRFWRPVTAIRAADTDGNPDTVADPGWLPEVGKTAPDPSYPGAHGAISAAAAQVLQLFFHKDKLSLTVTSESLPGVVRTFTSFSAVANEASLSRIYAGQHFRFDQVAGAELGRQIAQFVLENNLTPLGGPGPYVQHNLVSDLPGLADTTDPKLVNPWGIASGGQSPFWIALNHPGAAGIYTADSEALFHISLPGALGAAGGAPTGVVFNDTTNLISGSDQSARFVFAGEDGTLSAWGGGTNALLVADRSAAHAIYKGLGRVQQGNRASFFAADFHNGRVDIYDDQFHLVQSPGAFVDPDLPPEFSPFNIVAVRTNLLVSYAIPDADREDDVPGPGHGYVDVFDCNGHFVRHFTAGAPLNSPWGMVLASSSFGPLAGTLLIGNFGDGRINAFDVDTGAFVGAVTSTNGMPISIQGLWGLVMGNGMNGGETNSIYFTAGIAGDGRLEDHGLFGRITALPAPELSAASSAVGQLALTWQSEASMFLVQSSTSLNGPRWTDLISTTNRNVTVPVLGLTRYFRVVRP